MRGDVMSNKPELKKKNQGFMADLFLFMRENRKWWLTPIVIVLILLGVLVVLGGTSAAPFIYTLF
jgi:hypothetical protein